MIFLNQSARAQQFDPWQHLKLASSAQHQISIDAFVESVEANQGTAIAGPLWINLSHHSFNGSERVRAILLNHAYLAYYPRPNGPTPGITTLAKDQEFDLTWCGDHFAGKAPETFFVKYRGYGYVNQFFQELAIVVNGEWLKDPVSQSSNFLFQLVAPQN